MLTKRFHENGKISMEEEGPYISYSYYDYYDYYGQRDGYLKIFDEKGDLIVHSVYTKSTQTTVETYYQTDKKTVTEWKNNKKTLESVYNLKTGKMIEKAEFFSDGTEKKRYKMLGEEI